MPGPWRYKVPQLDKSAWVVVVAVCATRELAAAEACRVPLPVIMMESASTASVPADPSAFAAAARLAPPLMESGALGA